MGHEHAEGRHDNGWRLHLLKTLSEMLQQADGLAAVLDCVQIRFPALLKVDRITVLLYDAAAGRLVSNQFSESEIFPYAPASYGQPPDVSISGRCFSEARPVLINDCPSTHIVPAAWIAHLQLKSTVAVPILVDHLPLGVLRFDDTQNLHRFASEDVELFQLVAERISLSVRQLQVSADRTLAEEALRMAYEDLERRVEERTAELARANEALTRELTVRKRAERVTEVFARLGQKLSVADTPHAAADATLAAADELFGWDACFADFRYDGGRQELVILRDTVDGVRRDITPMEAPAPGHFTVKTLEEGPQLILRYDAGRTAPPGAAGSAFGMSRRSASLMFVPLSRGGSNLGVLSVQSYAANAYDPKDLELFVSLATFCCGAFERTTATEKLRRSQQALRQEKSFVQLLGDVAAASNQADSAESALAAVLSQVCKVTGWPVGHAILKAGNKGSGDTIGSHVWHLSDPERFSPFRETSEGLTLTGGIGLAGLVFDSGVQALHLNRTPQPWMRRKQVMDAVGLQAGFAFPVLVGKEVPAVLEFFSGDPASPNPYLLDVMSRVGLQLGRVIERNRAEERLTHGALHDPLTGLPNRAFFADALERVTARARRHAHYRFAVLYLDLDRFKMVNDSLGHVLGDKFLIAVAERLALCLREGDFVARLGGDEFAVLLDDIRGPADAVGAAERIQSALSESVRFGESEAYASASIGVALSRPGGDSNPLDLLRDADVAMYRAKVKGRACYAVFDEEMHAQVVRHLRTETELRRALDRGEFLIHYQPIVSMITGRVTGFEALVRWQHPERGLLLPSQFLPLAEETGLIVPIGWEVLRQACRWMRARLDAAPVIGDLSVSVNITARQLREPDLLERIDEALRDANLPPQHLHLEVTEGSVMEQVDEMVAVLTTIKSLGVQVLVDDFGTGYSSLSYLARFPIDALKIDQSFIQGLASVAGHSEVVQAILALACGLRLGVVAEGVETQAQLSELRGLGCELTQGNLFSRPLDAQTALRLPLVYSELSMY